MPSLDRLLPHSVRASLARRATVLIMGFCALVGLVAALAGGYLIRGEERARIDLSLSQLVETIDRTARIAAFTADGTLASEVAAGLLRNRLVARVVIHSGPNVLVAMGDAQARGTPLRRSLSSPFDDSERVGAITLIPDEAAIAAQVAAFAETIALLLGLVVAALAASVAWVVQSTVTRPIKAFSDALHDLDPHQGQRLPLPRGSESNELGRLVSDVNALLDRVVRRERIYRGIVSQAMDAITLVDIEADRFVEFNESAHVDLDLDHDTFAATSASGLLFPDGTLASRQRGLDLWKARVCEVRLRNPKGVPVDLRLSTRVLSLEGRPHAVCTWTNITSQKVAQEELRLHRDGLQTLVTERTRDLQKAKDSAEQANRSKSEFLSNMSHELRTPMHAILSFARLGVDRAERAAPEKLRHYFRSVVTSAERLLILLNDLLDLSKLEAGMMELDPQQEDLARLIEHVLAEFTPLAREKQLVLAFHNSAAATGLVCDAARLHQVLVNLLSNAVKFTPAGRRIEVFLSAAVLPEAVPALAVAVKDQGIGIPESELDKVFDKFVQSSKTRTGAGGTGLGLSITREIVALHGGTIAATNNAGGGACFTLVLPCEAMAYPVPA